MREPHNKYGEAVRYGPVEVSFITVEAWKDIYGYRNPQLPKVLVREPDQQPDILNSEDADHARFRKTMSHAFSDK